MARILREEAERYLSNVPEEYAFHVQDGRVLRNMHDLGEALNSIADETYAYHVNGSKNDFSRWVADIIRDEKLTRDLTKASNRNQAAKRVAEREAFLRSKLS